MTWTADFTNNPRSFISSKVVIVQEMYIATEKTAHIAPLVGPGPHAIGTANLLMSFTMEQFGPNTAACTLQPAGHAGAVPCYFLPYRPDMAVTMTLAGGANYFFTSTLTGCTVQAFGPAATPTITHANAVAQFTANVNAQRALLNATDIADPAQTPLFAAAEAAATTATSPLIDAMLPAAPVGTVPKYVRKTDYLGKFNNANVRRGKRNLKTAKGWHRTSHVQPELADGYKPTVGGFVYGVRNVATGNWALYYQSSISVTGQRHTGVPLFGKAKPLINQGIVLGPPEQFFP